MKKLLPIATCLILGVSSPSFAQTPEAFKYQASLRNSQGEVIADKLVSVRVSILSGSDSQSGKVMYSEVHTVSTNKLGLVNFEIGHGTSVSGDFAAINWENNKSFVRIEMDENGGSNFTTLGTSQLLSVPYSLHTKMASDVMPGSITIQNEIAARKSADKDLQSQINIVRGLLEQGARAGSSDKTLGVAQDLEALQNRFEADSAAKRTRINNNLTRFESDSAAKNTRINNNLTRFANDSVAVRTLINTTQNNSSSGVLTEKNRAEAAESVLQGQITSEVTRATQAEQTISGEVLTEKLRAEAAEAALAAQIQNGGSSGIQRKTTAQRDAMSPQGGEMIYNTTTQKFQGYQLVTGVETVDTKHTKTWTSIHFVNYMSSDYYFWTRQSQFSIAQSFTASSTNALTALTVYSNYNNGNGQYTLNIYAGAGINGTLLSTQPVTFENQNYGYNPENKFPISGVNVVAGQVYTFEIKSSVNPNFDNQNTTHTTGSQINMEVTSDEHNGSGYADGEMFVNGQPFIGHWNQVLDMRFKTHITPASQMGWETLR